MSAYPKKTLYYEDELKDDFASTKIERKPLPKDFKFHHENVFYRFFSACLYYIVAVPVIWIVLRLFVGARIVGKKKWKRARLSGKPVFVYGNHTSAFDALYVPLLLALPKRTRIISSIEAVSNPLIRGLEVFLAALPLPDTAEHRPAFVKAVEYHASHGDAFLIFPEAHIWPYSTRIRPFGEQAYVYPASLGAPVVSVCTTFERRKVLSFLPPRPVIHVSEVQYPDMDLPISERSKLLRDESYRYMVEVASSLENVEYYRYLPASMKKDGGE